MFYTVLSSTEHLDFSMRHSATWQLMHKTKYPVLFIARCSVIEPSELEQERGATCSWLDTAAQDSNPGSSPKIPTI